MTKSSSKHIAKSISGDEAKEKRMFSAAPVAISQDGNIVTVRRIVQTVLEFWSLGNGWSLYDSHTPKRFETDLHTGGDVTAGEITGNTTVKTGGGKLVFKHLEGTLTASTAVARSRSSCRGPIRIETSGGDIVIADSGLLDVKTSGGQIDVRIFRRRRKERHLQGVTGKIIGKTSAGSIRASISDAGIGDVRLETSMHRLLSAGNSGRRYRCQHERRQSLSRLPLETANVGREHLRGKLNGGGKSVELKTSVGKCHNLNLHRPRSPAAK